MAHSYRNVPLHSGFSTATPTIQEAWRSGVDDALDSRADSASGPALTITGWALESVRAFGHLAQDDPDRARQIVRAMGPQDRAVMKFLSDEMSRLVSEEEDLRTEADWRNARADRTDT